LFQDIVDVNSRPSTKCPSRNDEFCSKSRHAKKLTTGIIDKPGDATYYILVIDDEKAILKVVRTALSRAGFKVDIALDGQKGLQKFDSSQFDLVITDILMPGIDGRDIVKHIRSSDRPYIPIIGFSGTPWLFEKNQFDAVFTKPFLLKELVN
jgi:DNA-binding response OmpR family regulator